MSSLPPTTAATSHAQKRAREEESVEPSKRQRHNELQTPPEYPSNFLISYPQAPLKYIPRPSPPPPVQPAYSTSPDTHLSNTQGIDTGYGASEGGVYTPGSTYSNSDGQYGLGVSPQPPSVPQLSYGYPSRDYEYHANGQPAPTMQAMHAPGLPIPQAPRNYEQHYPMHPSMVTNIPRQQPQQTLNQQRTASTQGPIHARDSYTHLPSSQQTASLLPAMGTRDHYQSNSVGTTAAQAVRQKLYAEQEQWLRDAEIDLQEWTIKVIPAIPLKQGTVGALESIKDNLVPRDVWRLRALSPSQRYAAYRGMAELARKMVMYDQASEDYQTLWTSIVKFRAYLMRVERAWADSFKQGTAADNWARWNNMVEEQAVEIPVDQAIVDELHRMGKSRARMPSLVDVPVATETPQPLTSGPTLAKKKPARKQKSIPQPQKPIAKPVPTRGAPVNPVRPDTIKHPSDKTTVPKYPFNDIKDFSPNSATGRYKCMHPFETEKTCCKEGLTTRQMKQSISRSISTWKAKVEVMIDNGHLHKSHMTWSTYHNNRLRVRQKAAEKKRAEEQLRDEEVERERSDKEQDEQERWEKREAANAKRIERQRQRQMWQQHSWQEVDAGSDPIPVPASSSPEQHVAPEPELSPEEVAAETALQEEIAKALKRYERERKDCRRLESLKKWPNWSRFEEWWAARLLHVQCSQLSPEQEAALKGPEPSGIADKNPEFVKKTKEPLTRPVQEPADVEENFELEDSSLDDLFEDDGSEL